MLPGHPRTPPQKGEGDRASARLPVLFLRREVSKHDKINYRFHRATHTIMTSGSAAAAPTPRRRRGGALAAGDVPAGCHEPPPHTLVTVAS